MLDPSWALTRPILWLALAGLVALLVLRSIRKDRREYQRFKRYHTTAKRQAMFKRWLLGSFLSFGGVAAAVLLLAGGFVLPLLRELMGWPVVRDIRGFIAHEPGATAAIVIGLAVGFTVLTVVGVLGARKETELMSIGDIQAMLPRNRQELVLGGAMSINAGIFEELVFRLSLPALVYGATGSAVAAVVGTLLLFGGLHVYQGPAGIIGTAVVGAVLMALYVISGTILVPIVLHALFDLRSLVLLPVAVYEVHRVDGRTTPFVRPLRPPAPAPVDPVPEA